MERAQASRVGIGTPVSRKEDVRLVTGRGQYTDDINLRDECYATFVRSPHAHARVGSIDTKRALRSSGVIAVLTGADLAADGVLPIPHNPRWDGGPDAELKFAPGFQVFETQHAALAQDIVRFVGEPIAMAIAESREAADEAVALIEVDYAPLPALARAVDALASGAPSLWPGRPSNIALDCEVGDPEATKAAFAKAAHIVSLRTWIQRVTGVPMEPRSVIGAYDEATQRYVLHAGSGGGVIRVRDQFIKMFGLNRTGCRMLCGDMGGNFGTRNTFFPEYAVLPWAARRVGRPVKWTAQRQECFTSDYQGRDLTVEAELALDADGNFLGLRGTNISNIGAYTAHFTPLRKGLGIMQGVYAIPAVHFRGRAVMTNTAPTTPYRSAGRPEAIYVIERLVDLAAAECGFDPIALRRQNLIRAEAMPYTNAVGITYDSGEYARCMDTALDLADWQGFEERRARSANRGLLRGIGIANYVEVTSGAPHERAEVTIDPNGGAELVIGTMSSGQGHETSFAQLISEWLGIPFDKVRFVAHDTDRVSAGGGSHSGRSMRLASLAIAEASDTLIAKGRSIAAHLLQAHVDEVTFHAGIFVVAASGASVTLPDAARAALSNDVLPADLRGPLQGIGDVNTPVGGYPSGTHICEVEVDPETGHVEILRWYGADDVGLAVNPLILHGQVHGAVAQGIGQALLEDCHYDRESAQMLAASFMDYAMPRAHTVPHIASQLLEIPASSHRFGIRPGGEGGTTPALGAVINAIVNALSSLGVRHIEMPATPERVWRAIRLAKDGTAPAG